MSAQDFKIFSAQRLNSKCVCVWNTFDVFRCKYAKQNSFLTPPSEPVALYDSLWRARLERRNFVLNEPFENRENQSTRLTTREFSWRGKERKKNSCSVGVRRRPADSFYFLSPTVISRAGKTRCPAATSSRTNRKSNDPAHVSFEKNNSLSKSDISTEVFFYINHKTYIIILQWLDHSYNIVRKVYS